jgi:hypothetical protein
MVTFWYPSCQRAASFPCFEDCPHKFERLHIAGCCESYIVGKQCFRKMLFASVKKENLMVTDQYCYTILSFWLGSNLYRPCTLLLLVFMRIRHQLFWLFLYVDLYCSANAPKYISCWLICHLRVIFASSSFTTKQVLVIAAFGIVSVFCRHRYSENIWIISVNYNASNPQKNNYNASRKMKDGAIPQNPGVTSWCISACHTWIDLSLKLNMPLSSLQL